MELPEYKGPIVNNAVDTNRWDLVAPRPGDIIVATGSKMGTTWSQMLCALLVHGPELPRPLAEMSPWLDGGAWDYNEDSVEVFNAQTYRRVIKTHTPLHALKFREDAFYVTCGRDPRDVFLSGADHGANDALQAGPPRAPFDRDKVFAAALDLDSPRSLAGLFDHVGGFWKHRALPNLIFLHYNDMSDDLEGETARLAKFLGIVRSPDEISGLARCARFDAMRADADNLAPGAKVVGRWKSNADFFRKGRRGEWREVFSPETQALYVTATRGRYDRAMLDWLENGRAATGDPRDWAAKRSPTGSSVGSEESITAPSAAPDAWLDQHYAAAQTLVKIGRRRRLNLLIAGEGEPTVIFAAGLNGTALHWARVQPAVALRTRTVAFDKAGIGFSDPGPMPRTASAIVEDLRAALAGADIAPPYVLVGHSAGGPQMRLFAFRYPEEVVGMVMVDSSSEHQYRRMDDATGAREGETLRRELRRTYSRLTRLARTGALTPGTADYDRAVGPPSPTLTPAVIAAHAAQRTSPGFWRALRSEAAAADAASSDEIAATRRSLGDTPLGDMPLIVLTADKIPPRLGETAAAVQARYGVWRTMHDEIAALSTRGDRRTVEGAGHFIQLDKTEVVIAAIEEVIALARGG